MVAYPIVFKDDGGTLLGTFQDFPELTTLGTDREDALARAVDALEEAIAARIHDGRDISQPSRGREVALLPTLTAVKVMLYQGMHEQRSGKAERACRLGWHLPQVDRILDVHHNSQMDQVDAAMGAIGRHLQIKAAARR